MRKLLAALLVVGFTACQSVAGPDLARSQDQQELSVAAAASPNACPGQIVAGIASTWPWAHDGQTDFPPPPGAIALWVQAFGPVVGISSVHELQELFCG